MPKYREPIQIGEWELSEVSEQLRLESANRFIVITGNHDKTCHVDIDEGLEGKWADAVVSIAALKAFIQRYEELYGEVK